jgi:hypothetical protein
MFILIVGNLIEGFTHYGPFETFDDADEFSRTLESMNETFITTLHAPDETDEGAL